MCYKTIDSYYVNSFDRFGDDLCQLILTYLPLIQKIRFQCISKQWKSLIFNKQKILYLNNLENVWKDRDYFHSRGSQINVLYYLWQKKYFFQNLIKKFKYLKVLEMNGYFEYEIIDDLIKLQYLQHFSYTRFINESNLIKYVKHFGERLKSINIRGFDDRESSQLFKFTPNVEKVYVNHICQEFIAIFVPKLQQIYIKCVDSVRQLRSFTDIYCKQMKKMKVNFCHDFYDKNEDMINCFSQISRYVSLETLYLSTNCNFSQIIKSSIDCRLIQIGNNCKKFTQIVVVLGYHLISGDLFAIFDHFIALEKLSIVSNDLFKFKNYTNIESFNIYKSLKFLELSLQGLKDENFDSIHKYLPNLTQLLISRPNNWLTNETMNCLTKMQNLTKLKIFSKSITHLGFCDVISNCPKMRTIITINKMGFNVFKLTINTFIEIALKNPKIEYKFKFYGITDDFKYKGMPHNLTFN